MGERVGLRAAAEELGVHYMTAYRYVRSGRLAATKSRGEWQIDRDDLARLVGPGPERAGDDTPRAIHRQRLEQCLIAGDEPGAWGVVEAALGSGATPSEVLTDMLRPSLASIGQRWADGELAIADEHRGSAVAQRLIARMGPRFARRGRRRGAVVLGSAAGDLHSLPTAILGDLLRGEGLDVVDLGADCPAQVFVDAAVRVGDPCVVGVCVTAPEVLDDARQLVDELTRELPQCAVLLGGGAVDPGRGVDDVVALFVERAESLRRRPSA
jgi:excisionase family DNA binding protein